MPITCSRLSASSPAERAAGKQQYVHRPIDRRQDRSDVGPAGDARRVEGVRAGFLEVLETADRVGEIASSTALATAAGSSPNPFSRSADTGRAVAATIAAAWTRASSRLTEPSSRPRLAANPLLVVARASYPTQARIRADPASQGFGSSSGPSRWCSSRKRAAWSAVSEVKGHVRTLTREPRYLTSSF